MWSEIARPEQNIPKDPWNIWLILAGRGFGKTRTGAESVLTLIRQGTAKHIAFIGQTIKETHKIMVKGISGILTCAREKITYKKGEDVLEFQDLPAVIHLYGGDQYEKLRGPQFDTIWIDELAKFKYPEELWIQVQMTLRIGNTPKCIITTTPKPIPLLHQLVKNKNIKVTKGSTFDNEKNLSPIFIKHMKETYQGTRLGAQELEGELFQEEKGNLWKKSFFKYSKPLSSLKRIVIGVDPATTHNGCETGLVIAGKDCEQNGYILEDLSGRYTPHQWSTLVAESYHKFKADRIVVETNQGGDLIPALLKQQNINLPIKKVHAKRGKRLRAEPIVALYEQKKIFHIRYFKELEEQLLNFKPGNLIDRVDALVWALTELFNETKICVTSI